ncbi:MAG: hypothetical protein KTR31_20310 [Myxococcales bacterium]|nr:hypothetical protein [Myxococcales bacterium]
MTPGAPSRLTNPRALLLALLQAFDCDVPVQVLIRAASLFEIDENRTRVALHRLRSKGLVLSRERGSYHIAPGAPMSDPEVEEEVDDGGEPTLRAPGRGTWQHVLERLLPWDGRWIAVHTAPLPRADKTIARRRDRATQLVGLRELQSGLLVRPHNLAGGIDGFRERLVDLGLEATAPVFDIGSLGPHDDVARTLWDGLHLDDRYRRHIDRLTRLTLQVRTMPVEEAARQAFVAGGEAVRDIVTDPLLPPPLVDPALREAFVETMTTFDDVGRDLWSRVLDTDLPLLMAPTVEPT